MVCVALLAGVRFDPGVRTLTLSRRWPIIAVEMRVRLAVLVLLLCGIGVAWASGALAHLHPESIRAFLNGWGALGPVIFVGLYALGEIVAIPSVLFVIAAGMAWPVALAFPLAWGASVFSALVVFLISRYLGRDFVQRRLPGGLRDLDARLERGGVLPVAGVRLLAFLAPWTHLALAVSSVSARDYVLGTALGVLPGVLLLVMFGEAIAHWFDRVPAWLWLVLVVLLVLQVARGTSTPGRLGGGRE